MIPVLYEDEFFIIVDKPANLLSVPGRGPDKQDCLINRIHSQGYSTARIVHRLDYATSGLMVIALDAQTHSALSRLFQDRLTTKAYEAIIFGTPKLDNGIIDQPLRCDWDRRPLQIVDHEKGKHAKTHWKTIGTEKQGVRVELLPETGRSHQLRVHMQWLGHPISGDHFYATGDALSASDRLLLHAKMLGFNHPHTNEPMQFISAVPF